jgi:hypothetical protein
VRHRPLVAVLTDHWESGSEEGWFTRQVAGAVACGADVHVVTPDAGQTTTRADGVFRVHGLGTSLDPFAELRRDLLVEGIAATVDRPELLSEAAVATLVDRDLMAPWEGATALLADLEPDRVVIAGHRQLGAMVAVDRHDPVIPVALIALGANLESLRFPHFRPLLDRAESVLTLTHAEHDSLTGHRHPRTSVHRVGAPLAANPSARTEPDALLGSAEYVLVLANVDSDADHRAAELARFLRTAMPGLPLAVAYHDGLFVWHEGRVRKGPPVERSSDVARLMAWSRATVDLRPGRLFARRSVESLLYGTPIVVPHDSRAREHAELGKAGLWFADPGELTWCIEAMLDPATRASFGEQGQEYAEREYGSTDRFIARVSDACGLPSASARDSLTGADAVAG